MISEKDLKYLKQTGCSESVIRHSIAVTEEALKIAAKVKFTIDLDLLKAGAINHDIGRSRTHDLDHFVAGAEIARELGFEEKVINIIERHIGAGIPREEAVTLGLPDRDFIPGTPEEILVAYADNLARGDVIVSFEDALEGFRSRIGRDHPAIDRFTEMHEKVQSWLR
ncbi:MAG: TIGR00295 family protein [Nitrospira sp.]|nr:TIGR00295 family protein [bacterium]MBL7048441.1 TIGR00295 family protein [Nitrospira sp.]